jgi:cyclase
MQVSFRIIARLDVKPPNLVKGVHLEGFRKIGDPADFASKYYQQGADEINYQDIIASLYERNNISELVSNTAKGVFIPISVGGGIRKVDDAKKLLRCGADKVCLNTAALKNPKIISEIAGVFGRQAVVLGVEAKKMNNSWIVMTDNGREHANKQVLDWVTEAVNYGVGEILLTSIDMEGTMKGFDLKLINEVTKIVECPVIAHGGAGTIEDIVMAAKNGASGVAVASMLHYKKFKIEEIKESLLNSGVSVRIA